MHYYLPTKIFRPCAIPDGNHEQESYRAKMGADILAKRCVISLKKDFIRPHWTYLLQILSKLCFQRVDLSRNYEIVAISSDKKTFFNDFGYKADIGQHFHKK